MSKAPKPIRFKARWYATGFGEVIPNAVFTVAGGEIVEVKSGGDADEDLGDVVVTPGFVNAHCHLDLSSAAHLKPTGASFVEWLWKIVEHRRQTPLETVVAAAERQVEALLDTGTTTLGDVVGEPQFPVFEALSQLEYVRFVEVLGHNKQRWEPLWQTAFDSLNSSGAFLNGISPHAPYSTNPQAFRKSQTVGANYPICTHWFESREELELLAHGSGPLCDFLRNLRAWPRGQKEGAWSVDPWTDFLGRTDWWLLVHCNYMTASDLERAFAVSLGAPFRIAYCPRTHAAFGHEPYPLELFLRSGCSVCLGTDSLASNPDLDVFQEAKFVAAMYPYLDGATILRMLTVAGDFALKCPSIDYSTWRVRRSANFAAIASPSLQETKKPRARIDLRDLFEPAAKVVWVMRKGVPRRVDA